MGTIIEKANKIKETKNKLKEAINDGGGQITNNTVFNDYANEIKDIYIDAISDGVDNLYNNFPKVTGEGSEIILDTEEAPMKITLEGDTSQKTSVLPEEYTQVEYIESTGTQYINTGVNADDINYSFDIDFYAYETQPTTYPRIFGYQDNGGIILGTKFWYGNNTDINCTNILGTFNDGRHSVFANKDYAIIDNVKYNLNTPPTSFIKNVFTKIAIFGSFSGGYGTIKNDSLSKIKLYNFKIYHNNKLIRNFIPAVRKSDNEVGLYDIVTDTFYTNQGTGVFTYGSVVQIPNPDYPQDIKVVTGEQNLTIQNKNLFNKNSGIDYGKFYTNTGEIGTDNDLFLQTIYISVNSNTQYTISGYYTDYFRICEYDKSKNFIKRNLSNNTTKSFSIITTAQTKYVRISCFIRNLSSLQLEVGSTTSDYIEHQSQTYPLSLGNIELAKIGNYKDYIFKNEVGSPYYNANLDLNEWYLHKETSKVMLNGSETYIYQSNHARFLYAHNISNLSFSNIDKSLCNYFAYGVLNNNLFINNNYFYFYTSDFTSADNFKNFVQEKYENGNALTVYVPLATPTNTKITDTTLIQQLENINNNARSYLGTIVIECSATDNTNEAIQASIIALKNIDLIESEWSL